MPAQPQNVVARNFMERKGYRRIAPIDIEKLEDQPCWYYLYDLPEGRLELEVFWNGEAWETTVTTFALHSESRAS